MYDTRKITHGSEQVAMASTTEGGTTGFVNSTGVQKFAPSVDQDTKTIYADATTHMSLINPKKLTIEMDNLQYNETEMAQMGYKLVNGGYVDGGGYPTFDIQRILTVQSADGTTTQKLEVYYNATSTAYTESDDEDEDEINPKVYTRTLTVAGRSFDTVGNIKQFIVERTETNASVFDTYKTKILTPTDFESVV
jgi:hypothetical protein